MKICTLKILSQIILGVYLQVCVCEYICECVCVQVYLGVWAQDIEAICQHWLSSLVFWLDGPVSSRLIIQ